MALAAGDRPTHLVQYSRLQLHLNSYHNLVSIPQFKSYTRMLRTHRTRTAKNWHWSVDVLQVYWFVLKNCGITDFRLGIRSCHFCHWNVEVGNLELIPITAEISHFRELDDIYTASESPVALQLAPIHPNPQVLRVSLIFIPIKPDDIQARGSTSKAIDPEISRIGT
jgi:hypothetical protein